jgi:hypothetical protein
VDPGAGRNWNPTLLQDRMIHEVIKSGRKCMNKLQAVRSLLATAISKIFGLATLANLQVPADP